MKPSSPAEQSFHPISLSTQNANGALHKWWILISVGLGTFMTALDGSVVNTILPIIRRTFNSDVASVEWIVTIYLLVISSLLLSFGRLGDIQGHKAVYLTGFFIFICSSALCSLSNSVKMLVLCRGVQALGGAMLAANSPAILTKSFPESQRGQALGLQATMTYLGLTVGPSLGGWLADQFSWRSVFYINIPVGLIAVTLGSKYILKESVNPRKEKFDSLGALIFLVGLIALLLGLNQGHALGWSSPQILSLLVGSVVLLGVFLMVEKKAREPMLDLTLFRHRTFSSAVASAILNYICIYSILFLMPFYLIQGRGFSTSHAGLILTAQPVIMAIVAPMSGMFSDSRGVRLPSALGMSLLAVGLWLLSALTDQTTLTQITLYMGIVGLGTGIFISPNNSALMGSAPTHRQGIAAGVLATARNVGMVIGVGISGAIFMTTLGEQPISNPTALYHAIQVSFLAVTSFAILGAFISAIRPNQSHL